MKRSELPDSVFGIPEERKYPMPDKRHTLSAIKLFGHVEPKYEEELARNIIKNMKKYNIPESVVGKDNKLRKYIDKYYNESHLLEEYVSSSTKIYHLSQSNMDGKTISPRIPSNYFTKNGYEDVKTSRVCFAKSIDMCLRALSQKCTDMELYVHIPDGKYDIYTPSTKEVPDCKITSEVWIKEPVKLKCIGKIKVLKDKGEDGIPYKYGDKTAELYDWEWKWIQKINESYLLEENTSSSEYSMKPLKEDQLKEYYKWFKIVFNGDKNSIKDKEIKSTKVIYYKNEIVGYIAFSRYKDGNEKYLGIGNFMVIPKYQRSGHGKNVIKYIIDKYRDTYDLIYCWVDRSNTNAINFYKKIGKVNMNTKSNPDQYYVEFYRKRKSTNESYLLEESYLEEKYIMNDKDIYYNKDKFDNGEINLCFITGHSGSGKSTMGRNMQSNNIEHYELDDLQSIKDHFTMQNLKEYGDLIYSYFSGRGKKFYISYKEIYDNNIPISEYEDILFKDFVKHAMTYSKSHKNKKFVIEGVWLFCADENNKPYFSPEEFKDYAFYIKGTSAIVSKHRAALRDAKENSNGNKLKTIKGYISNMVRKNWKWYMIDEKRINVFRNYFSKLINEAAVSEFSVGAGPVVGITSSPEPIYIVNYLQNNVFSGAQQERFGICKAGMKDLHIFGGKYNRLHLSNLEEFEKEASNIKVYKYTGKPLSSIYGIIEDSSTDLDFYRLLTGEDIDKRSDIDFNPNFVRESYIKDELSAITECVNAGVKEIDNRYEIPMIGLNEDGRVYNYYRDLDGVYIKNEVTNMRSGSYIMAEDIPEEVSKLVKKGVY